MTNSFYTILYLVSVALAFYTQVKYFTKNGCDVNTGGAVMLLLVSAIPLAGVLIGIVCYLTTIDFPSLNIKFFKGDTE